MKSLSVTITRLLEGLVVIILASMSCLVFLNVVLRYGFNSSINVTEEVSRYLFVWLAFLGAILAFKENQHVSVTMLTSRLKPFHRQVLSVITDAMMLFCCYLIVDGSWLQFHLNLHNLAPISGLPQGITFLASVIVGSIIGLLLCLRLVTTIRLLLKGEIK